MDMYKNLENMKKNMYQSGTFNASLFLFNRKNQFFLLNKNATIASPLRFHRFALKLKSGEEKVAKPLLLLTSPNFHYIFMTKCRILKKQYPPLSDFGGGGYCFAPTAARGR